jgi:hypothetical protein
MASAPLARGGGKRQRAAEPAPARANQAGSTCPPWCTADHAKIHAHMSDPMTSGPPGEPLVRIVQWGDSRYRSEQPTVSVFKAAALVQLGRTEAEGLADLLEELADGCTPDQLRNLAGEVRAAAAVIDPVRQLTATVAEMSTDREME